MAAQRQKLTRAPRRKKEVQLAARGVSLTPRHAHLGVLKLCIWPFRDGRLSPYPGRNWYKKFDSVAGTARFGSWARI